MIAKVAAAGPEDVDIAVAAARKAFKSPEWRGLSTADRGKLIWKLADLCERDQHILATIDAWDNGKPYQVAHDEDIAEVISVFRYYAGFADKIFGRTIDTSDAKLAYTRQEPVGRLHHGVSNVNANGSRCLWTDHSLELPSNGKDCSSRIYL